MKHMKHLKIRSARIYLLAAAAFILLALSCAAHAADAPRPPRLYDAASLVPSDRASALEQKLDEISAKYGIDVAVVTVESLGRATSQAFADDTFDELGYGMGGDDSGIMLLVSTEERDWAISTHAKAIRAFTDAGQGYIMERVLPLMSDDEFADAFDKFADLCGEFLERAANGEPYDSDDLPKDPFLLVHSAVFALVCGLIISGLRVSMNRGELKSVRPQESAADYTRQGSMKLTEKSDVFLFSNVSMMPIPKKSSSGGGSSTHTSSSGRTHGGSSGKF